MANLTPEQLQAQKIERDRQLAALKQWDQNRKAGAACGR